MNQSNNLQAREAALAVAGQIKMTPTSLVQYQSRGRVAVIGDAVAAEFAPRLLPPLQAQVILLSGDDEPGRPLIAVGGRQLRVEGHMGAFRILLGDEGRPNFESVTVDLVLDLGEQPVLDMPVKPVGYLHCDTEESSLSRALLELGGLTGTFEKPRFFDYDASVCAHGRSGKTACTRCIDACPTDAISSLAEKISVDPYLCQGGGVCATVCPAGAIRYSYPDAADQLRQVQVLLKTYREHSGENPVVVFVSEADADLLADDVDNYLPVVVEELASVGMEIWLSCLAYGAKAVHLFAAGSMPQRVADALEQQLTTAHEILQGLGYPQDALCLSGADDRSAVPAGGMPEIKPATFAAMGGKRQTAFFALDHLYEQAERSRPMVNLSVGAPFGMAQVDAGRCTLCMSCVGVCPGKALQQGEGLPQLRFLEVNCLQCGMCTRTCPEDAISISPRMVFEREQRAVVRVLHEEEPFCCVSCSKPFATRSVIDKMMQKLQTHWMFQDERARQRLMMCEDCRVVDAVQDPQAMQAGLDGFTRQ